jgi:hypothetical protein
MEEKTNVATTIARAFGLTPIIEANHGAGEEENYNEPVWLRDRDGDFSRVSMPLKGPLPSGMYEHNISSDGKLFYRPIKSASDDIINLPGLPIDYVLNQIEKFWDSAKEYARYGFLQKRGIMFYGPPGCGKTCCVALLRDRLIQRGGVIFTAGEGFSVLTRGIADFRKSEPDRPIMTLVEDLETFLEGSDGANSGRSEKAALSLYDGEHQFNNVVHIATTNKPDVVADRFIRRPGRFDLVIGLHQPARETREAYLTHICKDKLTAKQTQEILDCTEGLSLAYLREIATTYLVLGIPLEETTSRLKKQAKQKYTPGKTGFTVGFTTGRGEED